MKSYLIYIAILCFIGYNATTMGSEVVKSSSLSKLEQLESI